MRLVFMGSPEFALPSLERLLGAGHEVALVVTQPDRPAGRGQRVQPSPVAAFARARGLPLYQPETLKPPEAVEPVRAAAPDVIVVAAYGLILPQQLLAIPPHGSLNVHPSLLPRWRGAAPVQAAILAGDPETGVSIMLVEPRMDAGPVLAQRRVPVLPNDDALTLSARLAALGADLLVETLPRWVAGAITPRPQDEALATYAPRIQRADAELDWSEPADLLARKVRAYRGWPDAHTFWDGRLLKVLAATPLEEQATAPPSTVLAGPGKQAAPRVVTGRGLLQLDRVALAGRSAVSGAELVRGFPALIGARLGGRSEA